MHASLEPILFQMLFLLPILKREDRSLYHLFERTQLHPYFCLSWIITWYAHDLKDFECICRIFDFCLCTNPILPIYMSTALVLMNRDAILDQEPDYALLHHFLSTLPSQSDTLSNHLEEWLAFSFQLYQRYPLTTLKALTGWTFPSQYVFDR
ncbi:hypothetical protein HMI56_005822 [Coelomomyces lativittatus]|nr:hypothetical protein HMI56_005822 [Coelomomyces lativittatus]